MYKLTILTAIVMISVSFNSQSRGDELAPAPVGPSATSSESAVPAIRQPSFVEMGGQMRRNEHAVVLYVDGKYLPAPVVVGYRYAIFYWWEMGLDVGGNAGFFEALVHLKMENFKTKKTERFFWGFVYDTGFKVNDMNMSRDLTFDSKDIYLDDRSWIHDFKNSFALRFGKKRDKAVYLVTEFYIDQDLHTPRRQNDLYFGPAHLGFETALGNHASFFVEAGAMWSINGTQTEDGIKYKGDWFPVAKIGMAARTGDRTARDPEPKPPRKERRQR